MTTAANLIKTVEYLSDAEVRAYISALSWQRDRSVERGEPRPAELWNELMCLLCDVRDDQAATFDRLTEDSTDPTPSRTPSAADLIRAAENMDQAELSGYIAALNQQNARCVRRGEEVPAIFWSELARLLTEIRDKQAAIFDRVVSEHHGEPPQFLM